MDIYRSVYGEKPYQIGLAESNLGRVYVERKEYARAELLFRDTLQIYSQTLPGDHQNVGICRVRLGDALAAEHRFKEAEAESLGGYQILSSESSGPQKWIQMARQDLASEYDTLHQPSQAAQFRPAAAKP